MTDELTPIAYPEPSADLIALLEFLEEARWQLARVCQFEYQHEELQEFSTLHPAQIDKLLTWGRL